MSSTKAWVGLLPWEVAIRGDVRAELDWLTEAHMWHGSLRFTLAGILITSEMLDDYPELAKRIRHHTKPFYVPR